MASVEGIINDEASNAASTMGGASNYLANSYQMTNTGSPTISTPLVIVSSAGTNGQDDYGSSSSLDKSDQQQARSSSKKRTSAFVFAALLIMIVAAYQLVSRHHDANPKSPADDLLIHTSTNDLPATNNNEFNINNEENHLDAIDQVLQQSSETDEPLSTTAPSELNTPNFDDRPDFSRPTRVFGSVQRGAAIGHPLPTNEWFLNLLVGLRDNDKDDTNFASFENRVYTLPYILDTVGTIVGTRLHFPHMLSWGTGVQSSFVDTHGLTLGTADTRFSRRYTVDEETLPRKLGVGIRWEPTREAGDSKEDDAHMRSSIIRGMPYGTMQYAPGVVPAIASETRLASLPMIDSKLPLACGTLDNDTLEIRTNSTGGDRILVNRDIELHFAESDFTWLVFFSRPVFVECFINPQKTSAAASISHPPGEVVERAHKENLNAFLLRVVLDTADEEAEESNASAEQPDVPLIARIALGNNCTTGVNVQYCEHNKKLDNQEYMQLLRDHADIYPSDPAVSYAYSSPVRFKSEKKSAYIYFDWTPRSMIKDVIEYTAKQSSASQNDATAPEEGGWFSPQTTTLLGPSEEKKELLMYALPHHTDILRPLPGISSNTIIDHCVQSIHGKACLVLGGKWAMEEDLSGPPNFMAARPPDHRAIPALAKALASDIHYSLPEYFQRGVGDTYFSGKMLAKLGRIIVIASELKGLAATPDVDTIHLNTTDGLELMKVVKACKQAKLPTQAEIDLAIGRLRSSVEIWLNGTAGSPFVYDTSWGGIVNCGCHFNEQTQICDNHYPDCPTFSDAGLNFGNGFYNDHHFHYGYHISAAAVVANYDLDWGRKYFENVLLLIRDIANPSVKDIHFPPFRQKDWYLGNSWASGIATNGGRPYMNGRNQESSSEAIAAYEAIAMYGSVMVEAWGGGISSDPADTKYAYTAARVRDVGRLLTASELRSADRYWHVWHGNNRRMIYPPSYEPPVVGMMWDTMVQFQTWFGNAPYLACGIQLLPLTPVSERRDNQQWARQLYPSFSKSCEEHADCTDQGWSILQYAILATVGHRELALQKVLGIPKAAFGSAGGSGHSLSNSIWYISTRPDAIPLDLENPSTTLDSEATPATAPGVHCGCASSCTEDVLNSDAGGASCKMRIQWLMANRGSTELQACKQVGSKDYPSICGKCDPTNVCDTAEVGDGNVDNGNASTCLPCTTEVCNSKQLNRCEIHTSPYLCHTGPSRGGCSAVPWAIASDGGCSGCCELFEGCENLIL